jgi:hypothetical protein
VADRDKHNSLLHRGIDYNCKKLITTVKSFMVRATKEKKRERKKSNSITISCSSKPTKSLIYFLSTNAAECNIKLFTTVISKSVLQRPIFARQNEKLLDRLL